MEIGGQNKPNLALKQGDFGWFWRKIGVAILFI